MPEHISFILDDSERRDSIDIWEKAKYYPKSNSPSSASPQNICEATL